MGGKFTPGLSGKIGAGTGVEKFLRVFVVDRAVMVQECLRHTGSNLGRLTRQWSWRAIVGCPTGTGFVDGVTFISLFLALANWRSERAVERAGMLRLRLSCASGLRKPR